MDSPGCLPGVSAFQGVSAVRGLYQNNDTGVTNLARRAGLDYRPGLSGAQLLQGPLLGLGTEVIAAQENFDGLFVE